MPREDIPTSIKCLQECNDYLADIEINHFIDCAANGTECLAKAEDGIEVMKILDAIYLSAKTGHEVIL